MSPQPGDVSRETVLIVQQQISPLLILIKAKRISLFTHTDHRSSSCLHAPFDLSFQTTLAEKTSKRLLESKIIKA